MVMDAVGSAVSAVGQALGLIKPDKAKLVVRAAATCPTAPHEIECMFNPTDYTLTQTVDVHRDRTSAAKPGGTAAVRRHRTR